MEIRLGGLLTTLATDIGGLTQQMNIEVAQRGGLIRPHSITPDLLVNAMQKFVVDMNWSSTGKTNATWGDGTITFGDGRTQSLDAGSKSDLDDTHVDFAYFIVGDDAVHWTHNFGETIGAGRGFLAACTGGKTGDAGAYIKTSNGKADVINASMVICDYLSAIVAHLGDVGAADGAVRINDSGIALVGALKLLAFFVPDLEGDVSYLYCNEDADLCFEGFNFLPVASGSECGSAAKYWNNVHSHAFTTHSPQFPILEGGYLKALLGRQDCACCSAGTREGRGHGCGAREPAHPGDRGNRRTGRRNCCHRSKVEGPGTKGDVA
ncbi:MAG: hypothetical protein NTU41_09725 [Chloroflexi bacterium]|nr:hypothetical protein [Chloroflexota bacterium]